MNASSIPIKVVYEALSKLGLYFCGFTEKTIIVNGDGIGWIWTLVNNFIPEHSKQKILFVNDKNK
jgi:hypothetical protein